MTYFDDQLWKFHRSRRSPRTVASGSAGAIAFFAGVALAGQIMLWAGCFELGKTPAIKVLDYWPGFLTGGLLLGIPAVFTARKLYDLIHHD
ncbi:MAG: hypothetical protein ABL888_11190 [Pirellulaceae bacterium]